MKEYQIKTGPIDFLAILDLRMESAINCHGTLSLSGYIADEEEEGILKLLRGELWEKIEEVSQEGEVKTLFFGIVTSWRLEHVNDQKKLSLFLATGSILLDQQPHLRTFQDQEMAYEEILRLIISGYEDAEVIANTPMKQQTGGLLLQYRETDWAFLKRIASRHQRFLVPEPGLKGVKIFYDLPDRGEIPFSLTGKYEVKKDLTRYRKKQGYGLHEITESDCLTYTMYGRERRRIGEYALIERQRYHVYRVSAKYQGGEMLYTCKLCKSRGMSVPDSWCEEMTGAALEAEVLAVTKERVQVRVLEDENKEQRINIWYPYATIYSTPDGTGWYCMPEPGDRVRLTIPQQDERQAFITSSVHLETDSSDRKNPDHKVLKSKYQKEIRFTPDTIVITNNQGTRIELNDSEGIRMESGHSIMLEAAEDIIISSDTASLLLAGTESVNIKQRGTSIDLSDGVVFQGGELRVQ